MTPQVLDDLLAPGLTLAGCGSAELVQYYAGPENRFWRTPAEHALDT